MHRDEFASSIAKGSKIGVDGVEETVVVLSLVDEVVELFSRHCAQVKGGILCQEELNEIGALRAFVSIRN
jgi:hypothetical protein